MTRFGVGHGAAAGWRGAVDACLERLDVPAGANLGFVYVTDSLASDLGKVTAILSRSTGVCDWVGTTGVGICATGQEYHNEPAVAAMVGYFPEGSFDIFSEYKGAGGAGGNGQNGNGASPAFSGAHPGARGGTSRFGVVHADPRKPEKLGLIPELADEADCFLVGGLSSSRGAHAHVAGQLTNGALSGVLFSEEVPVATGLTQGCTPIGPVRRVTNCRGNIAIEIDGRPALEVFREDIGELLARDLRRVSGYIFAAFPVEGADDGDYMVRNLIGMDTAHELLAFGSPLTEGRSVMFCRRDVKSAETDLRRMVADVRSRAPEPPKGAIYYSCVGRGPQMFGNPSAELETVREELGDVPLVGFFCNGEISHNRLYGYSGVLSLFL